MIKDYLKPELEYVDFVSERIADPTNTGSDVTDDGDI